MRKLPLTLLFTLATCISSLGAEFYEVEYGREPNHLVPTEAPSNYEREVAKRLCQTNGRFGQMVVRPSFGAEFCLSVHADNVAREASDEALTYVMTVTEASGSIWSSLSPAKGKKTHADIKIARFDKKISLDLAVAIQRVWARALHLTRYPSCAARGLDGTTYQFSVWVRGLGYLQGETWSPKRGLPRELVDMGMELLNFVCQNDKKGELTERELIKKLAKIESRIPKPLR